MNLTPFMMVLAIGQLVNMVIAARRLGESMPELVRLFRRQVNPPYPLTSTELMEQLGPLKMNTPIATPYLLKTFVNQLRLIFSSHSKNPDVMHQAQKVRSEIFRFLSMSLLIIGLIFILGLAAIGVM